MAVDVNGTSNVGIVIFPINILLEQSLPKSFFEKFREKEDHQIEALVFVLGTEVEVQQIDSCYSGQHVI